MRKTGNWTAASVLAVSMMFAGGASAQSGSGTQTPTGQGSMAQSGGSPDTHANRSPEDLQKFVQKAAIGNLAEVELSRLALERAENPEVKNYAQMMVDEHTKALEQLRQVASNAGVEVPSSLEEKHQKKHEKLSAKSGNDFDREYMKMMIASHKNMENLLEDMVEPDRAPDMTAVTGTTGTSGTGTAGTSGTTTSGGVTGSSAAMTATTIDSWALTTLGNVRSHLEMAKDLEKRVKQ
jgi:putative membrane protein